MAARIRPFAAQTRTAAMALAGVVLFGCAQEQGQRPAARKPAPLPGPSTVAPPPNATGDGCTDPQRIAMPAVLEGTALAEAVAELDRPGEGDNALERLRGPLGLLCHRGSPGLRIDAAQRIAAFQTSFARSLLEVNGRLDPRTLRYLSMVFPALRSTSSACAAGEGAGLAAADNRSIDAATDVSVRRFQRWVAAARPEIRATGALDAPTRDAWQRAYPLRQPDTNGARQAEMLPSCLLRWEGATAEQLRFMRTVYEIQRVRASQKRDYVGSTADVEEVEDGKEAARAAASAGRALLAAIRKEGAPKTGGRSNLVVVTAYRSAPFQLEMWEYHFPARYGSTARARGSSPGGPHGDDAAMMMAGYYAARTASPGYSLHNRGTAIDFGCVLRDGRLVGATGQFIGGWKQSWCLAWLKQRAGAFGFRANPEINEPWHWEFAAETP